MHVFRLRWIASLPPALSIAVANAGGLGLRRTVDAAGRDPRLVAAMREKSNGGFQTNLWIADPPPERDAQEDRVRQFLSQRGPPVELILR